MLWDVEARSESLPAEYDPMVYLYGALCSHNLKWEQVWNRQTIEDFLESWFTSAETTPILNAHPRLIQDLKEAGWVIRREKQ